MAPDFLSSSYLTGAPPCGISMMTLTSCGGLSPTGMLAISMTRCPQNDRCMACLRERGAELRHQRAKIGKARRDHGRVVDGDRLTRAKPERKKGHGDAMVHMRRNQAAAFDPAFSVHDQ